MVVRPLPPTCVNVRPRSNRERGQAELLHETRDAWVCMQSYGSTVHQDYATYPADGAGTSATAWMRNWLHADRCPLRCAAVPKASPHRALRFVVAEGLDRAGVAVGCQQQAIDRRRQHFETVNRQYGLRVELKGFESVTSKCVDVPVVR